METLASRIKYLIDTDNLSVTAAAKKCDVPQPRLNDIVLGNTMNPRSETIRKIAKGLCTTEGWLLTGKGKIRNHPTVNEQHGEYSTAHENLLFEVIRDVEADVERRKIKLTPEQKAGVIRDAYKWALKNEGIDLGEDRI